MSAAIVDYLLVFWSVLAVVVFIAGSIYEKHLKDQAKRKLKQRPYQSDGCTSESGQWQSSRAQHYPQSSSGNWSSGGNSYDQRYGGATLSSQGQSYSHQSTSGVSSMQERGTFNSNSKLSSGGYCDDHYDALTKTGYPTPSDAYDPFHFGGASAYELAAVERQRRRSDFGTGNVDAQYPAATTIPTASGFNNDCVEWVNGILFLFYTQPEKYGPIISENVCRSLNERLSNIISSSNEPHSNLIIEFDLLDNQQSSKPELTNIRTESESDKAISVTCKLYTQKLLLTLTIKRANTLSTQHQNQVKHYELLLENLEGKLKSMAMLNEKLIVIQFLENPDTKVILRPLSSGPGARSYDDFTNFGGTSSLINEDLLVQLILQALAQVVVDLYFGNDADFPQYKHHHHSTYSNYKSKLNNIIKGSASELKRQINALSTSSSAASASDAAKERKVFVKIVRAKNINYNKNVTCLMELDSPSQQAISSTKRGSDPFWDEHFLFAISEKTSELVLELWDSIEPSALQAAASHLQGAKKDTAKWLKGDLTSGANFLGLARVSIDELRQNPIQKLSLALQPQAASTTGAQNSLHGLVGGELQLELLFMEHSRAPSPSVGAGGNSNSLGRHQTSGLHKSSSQGSLAAYQQGDVVSIDRKLTPSGFVITTTTITKQQHPPKRHLHLSQQQQYSNELTTRTQSPTNSASMVTDHSLDEMNFDGVSSTQFSPGDFKTAGTAAGLRSRASSPQLDRRSEAGAADSAAGGRLSRSRSRSRSFIRAIKKRFSFSRTRAHSVGESGVESSLKGGRTPVSGGNPLSLEADCFESRSRASSELSTGELALGGGRAKSVPVSRDPSEVPTIVINRSRLSDTTGSAFTFDQPKSQLVIEVFEPTLSSGESPLVSGAKTKGHYRYYAVPEDASSKRKWRKRGLKLHVFNEHQFVACHLAGSSTCHLCGRVFSRRPGKQGYKCRNCHLLSHKQCHVKVDHNCPYAARDGLKLEYIDADPPANLMEDVAMPNQLLQDNQASGMSAASSKEIVSGLDFEGATQTQQQQQARPQRQTRNRPNMKMTQRTNSTEADDR